MHQRAGALEVGQELVTQADALARALDQAGDIRDHELSPVGRVHRAEDRLERRERVRGDLRPRVRDARDERRLARVRQPHEGGIREQLEPQLELAALPGQPGLGKARRLTYGRREVAVATAAGAAARDHDPSLPVGQVGDDLAALVQNLRPDRDDELDVVAVRPVLVRSAARAPAAGAEAPPRAERRKVTSIRIGAQHDIAAPATVSPVGAASGNVLLAAEAHRAVAAAAGLDLDVGAVGEA